MRKSPPVRKVPRGGIIATARGISILSEADESVEDILLLDAIDARLLGAMGSARADSTTMDSSSSLIARNSSISGPSSMLETGLGSWLLVPVFERYLRGLSTVPIPNSVVVVARVDGFLCRRVGADIGLELVA